MMSASIRSVRPFPVSCLAAVLCLAAQSHAQINPTINREVWKQKYGVLNAQMDQQSPYLGWLDQDADGDGVKNGDEFLAGTNPFQKLPGESHFQPPTVAANPTSLSLTFPTVVGKLYGAESSQNLMDAWSKGSLPSVSGDGTPKMLTVPLSAGKFFHLSVTDQATQGDQVSDWAKSVLGLSGNSPIGAQTSFDHTSLAANLQLQNEVTLSAIDTEATPAGDYGVIRITRSGFMLLGPVTVPLFKTGTAVEGTDFAPLPASVSFPVGVNSLDITILPLFNASRTSPATVFLTAATPGSAGASGSYTLGSPASAGVTIYPSATPAGTGLTATYTADANSSYNYTKTTTTGSATITYSGTPAIPFVAGNPVNLWFSSGNLKTSPYSSPLSYTIVAPVTATTFKVNFAGASLPSSGTGSVTIIGFGTPVTRLDPTIDFTWGTGTPSPSINVDYFSTRWTGQILPQYSQKYNFVARVDDGVQLWVNNQLIVNRWPGGSVTDTTGSINLQAGVLYDIRMDYYEATGSAEAHLSWYSDDQAKQIIPMNRLFPTTTGRPAITSPTNMVTLLGSGTPFSTNLTSSNGGTITASGLPAWLSLLNGVLSGTPPAAGIYQFTLTTTNAAGSGSAVMTLEVIAAGSQLTRELWTGGVTGPALANVPWTTPPATSDTVAIADDATPYPDNTGERLRGYFIPPTTGNYYFWIAASNAAELWISNNSEPVNRVLRAKVTGPAGTSPKIWDANPNQKSRWLSLVAGKRYYIEALHNTGASGSSSHLSVAWFLDPTGNTTNPITNGCPPAAASVGGVIPTYAISPWDNPPTTTIPGTLYVTNLQGAQGLTGITGTGGAFLRVNGTSAVLQLNYIGLTSGATSRKIYNSAGTVLFDINAQEKNYPTSKTTDGGYTWTLQASDLESLDLGGAYLGISTLNNPSGELAGTFGKIAGSQTAPPVPAYPPWTDLHDSSDGANSRFLTQATFGPSPADMASVKVAGYRPWIENQFIAPITKNVPYILENLSADPQNPYGSTLMFNSWWKNSVTAPDQLRQRAAFALSEILVVSDTGPLNNNGRTLADYYDILLESCFGNFRDILKQVTLSSAMGVYLDMRANTLGNIQTGLHPNENYAREILQLFSAGLYRTWPDGSLVLDSKGNAIPTYNQEVVTGMARVFTGWNWGQALQGSGRLPTNFGPATNYLDPMVLVPAKHELGSKILLDNVVLPPATNIDPNSITSDPNPITIQTTDSVAGPGNLVTTAISNQYDLNGLKDLEATLDNIMANSAVGPYICRQLIQRLVTSHPKPEYVQRVVRAFNGEQTVDGVTGTRGDMKEVFRAILLDAEARGTTAIADNKFGKQREPLLRVTGPARAFPTATFPNSTYSQNGLGAITITTRDLNGNPIPHRLVNESVRLSNFVATAGSTELPTVKTYSISGVAPNSFIVDNNSSTLAPTYTVSGLSATINSGGFAVDDDLYVSFTSGGLTGVAKRYSVVSVTGSSFTVTLDIDPGIVAGGNCLIPKLNAGYNVSGNAGTQSITIQTSGNHSLVAGVDDVLLKFVTLNSPVAATSGIYPVTAVTAPNAFRITVPATPTLTNGSQGSNSVIVYPLKGSQWVRSGTVTVDLSTWGIGTTPTNLNQTPLNSTTVFNYFYPDYQYPGAMAKAGMTTPEFQLTNDSNTMNLTNLITQGTLTNNTGNLNGYVSFFGANAIMMDLASYMTPAKTSNAGVPALVSELGVLLTGGPLSTQLTIENYVKTNLAYTTPTSTQMRDRVRAIVHLIVTSAEYAIQK